MYKLIITFIIVFMTSNLLADKNFVRDRMLVLDKKLNLIWQDDPAVAKTKLTLEDAKTYCKNLKLSGQNNWRLPNYEELYSITDYAEYKPTINKTFKNTASGHYWSFMTKVTPTGKGLSKNTILYFKRIWFSDGVSYDNDRTGKAYVRCVHEKN